MAKLKPCPLCEGEAVYALRGGMAAHGCGEFTGEIECMDCGLLYDTPSFETAEEAEKYAYNMWNRRPRERKPVDIGELSIIADQIDNEYKAPDVAREYASRIRKAIGEAR